MLEGNQPINFLPTNCAKVRSFRADGPGNVVTARIIYSRTGSGSNSDEHECLDSRGWGQSWVSPVDRVSELTRHDESSYSGTHIEDETGWADISSGTNSHDTQYSSPSVDFSLDYEAWGTSLEAGSGAPPIVFTYFERDLLRNDIRDYSAYNDDSAAWTRVTFSDADGLYPETSSGSACNSSHTDTTWHDTTTNVDYGWI